MKIGLGKRRIIWFAVFGAAIGAVLLLLHILAEKSADAYDHLLLLATIPLIAAIMAYLATKENAIIKRTKSLEEASEGFNNLIMSAISEHRRSSLVPSPNDPRLTTCWKKLDCHKEDCPVYGQEHARCWLIAGTFCRGQVQGQFAQKLGDCRLCEVYKAAVADPVDEITEMFHAMNYLLSEREEQLEKVYLETRAKSEKLARLVSFSEAALSAVHLSDLLQNLLESAGDFVGADMGWVSLADETGETLKPRVSFGFNPVNAPKLVSRAGEGIAGQAFAGRYIAVSENLATDSRETNVFLKALKARTLICLPLFSGGIPIGILVLGTLTPHHYTDEEKDSLHVAANGIAAAVENARLVGEVGRERGQAEMMQAIAAEAGSGNGISGCYNSFVMHASQVIGFDQSCMFLWLPGSGEVEIVDVQTKAPRTWLNQGMKIPVGSLAAEKVIGSRRPLIRGDITGYEYPLDKLLVEEGIKSSLLFPLISKGEVLGIMHLGSFKDHAFSSEDVEILEPATRQLGLVLDNVRVLQEAERSSLLDSTTGLFGHRYFFDALRREIAVSNRYQRPLSLIRMHVNGFKKFNDSLGDGEAKDLLREIARSTRSSVREVDIVARYGGHDFAVLLPEVSAAGDDLDNTGIWSVSHRIRDRIIQQVFHRKEWSGTELSLSMGVAEYPLNAGDAAGLLEKADWALREARQQGLNDVVMAR